MRGKRADLTGLRFGKLEVVEYAGAHWATPKVANATWRCRCDCGNEMVAQARKLKRGRLLSCGCLRVRHGHHRRGQVTKTYRTWSNMLSRCRNPNATCYADYGGRGITVCERWLTFANFLADMGECPPSMTIERRNNNGNYEPSNCYWATPIDQANNKRNTRYVTYRGEQMSIARLASLAGLPYSVVQQRISKYGWSAEDAANTPILTPSQVRYGLRGRAA
jgi:hypothetical protein